MLTSKKQRGRNPDTAIFTLKMEKKNDNQLMPLAVFHSPLSTFCKECWSFGIVDRFSWIYPAIKVGSLGSQPMVRSKMRRDMVSFGISWDKASKVLFWTFCSSLLKWHWVTEDSQIIIIIDNFCIALFSGVPKLNALYILQHFLSFTNTIHIIMTTNNV